MKPTDWIAHWWPCVVYRLGDIWLGLCIIMTCLFFLTLLVGGMYVIAAAMP
jgi:hypothetical protein